MSASDVVKDLFAAAEAGDYEKMESLMSDDFEFSGPVPAPIGSEAYIALQRRMRAGFPDWSFNLSDVHEHGDAVHSEVRITGTHTGDLDLREMGFGLSPATGKAIKLRPENPECTVAGGKVTKIHVESTGPDGGVGGILKQIGA